MDKVNSYRELKAQEVIGSRTDVEVVTTVGFLLALRSHREVSLRDEFAKAALSSVIASHADADGDFNPSHVAYAAYAAADAMLAFKGAAEAA